MNIGQAIEIIKSGGKARRATWEGMEAFILVVTEQGGTPLIAWESKDHPRQAWMPTSADIMAEDWVEA